MTNNAWEASALVAIVAGLLTCFWGYRLLKLSLGIIGFVAGAGAGWELGSALFHGSNGVLLICALIGGLIGMGLCLWLYFLGIFLIGAMAGIVVAAAFVHGTGQQVQGLLFIALPVVFGVIALVAQKIMVAVCTGFSGAYLITAGAWSLLTGSQADSGVWLYPTQHPNALGTHGYAALALWIVLALLGAGYQLRSRHRKVEVVAQKQ